MNAPQLFKNYEALGVVTPDTPVKVGKTYLVMCAVCRGGKKGGEWLLPIVPFIHQDRGLGVYYDHYHMDGRFVTKRRLNPTDSGGIGGDGRTLRIFKPCTRPGNGDVVGLELAEMKCVRNGFGIPLMNYDTFYSRTYNDWIKKYEGKKCHGRRCPHYGALMHERNGGVLECPLHGLFADSKTERIIPRSQAIERIRLRP